MSTHAGVRPAEDGFALSVLAGLRADPKWIDSKWFYDAEGSRLFDRITALPDYYPTGRETAILRSAVPTLAEAFPPDAVLLEIGSGSSAKTRLLLDGLPGLGAYAPLDISASHLEATALALRRDYPDLAVTPVVADFTEALPDVADGAPVVVFFPGSTIGNLLAPQAAALLARFRAVEGACACLIGVDLVKDVDVLLRAYDDPTGVTAAFNRNVLHRINRELDADVPVDAFAHEARWNPDRARIEMHLRATRDVAMTVEGARLTLRAGETIHTENSHKYTPDGFAALARAAGWRGSRMMTDPDGWFGVFLLTP